MKKNADIFANWIDADNAQVVSKKDNDKIQSNKIIVSNNLKVNQIQRTIKDSQVIVDDFINYGDYYLQTNYKLNYEHEKQIDNFRNHVESLYFLKKDDENEKNKNRQVVHRKGFSWIKK
ncbi:hypothetical protein [Spiroplasma endosymbiont of Amphibalanus improvisus]|uniref:hypothetical protein n=1 Tax=Spiroplasma endosymbiont of Amphibalanus improvisus TaxID=3066327 RepID=UPI00313C9E63